jgi:hypothetical protein
MSDSSAKQKSPSAGVRTNIADSGNAKSKQPFEKPKLTFVAPKLVKHGEVTELTGFFGAFSP